MAYPATRMKEGERYGRLVIVKRAPRRRHDVRREVEWECRCGCGNVVVVKGVLLRAGKVKSCGCLRRDVAREMGRARRKG